MKNNWSNNEAKKYISKYKKLGHSKDMALRVYTTRLLGRNSELVLHGGGNTSVKTTIKDLDGKNYDVLCVKGSGWDMAEIEPEGLPAVKLQPLLSLKNKKYLSDEDMVAYQKRNLIDIKSPNPSVETFLHAEVGGPRGLMSRPLGSHGRRGPPWLPWSPKFIHGSIHGLGAR